MALHFSDMTEPICVRPNCKRLRDELTEAIADNTRLRTRLARQRRRMREVEADNERLRHRFDWDALGGERVMLRFTPTEQRIIEALDLDGRLVAYVDILKHGWPKATWDARMYHVERHVLNVHLARLRRKLAGTEWEVITRVNRGLVLRRRTA